MGLAADSWLDRHASTAWSEADTDCSLPAAFARVVARSADRPAIAGGELALSYRELHELADGYARACLRARTPDGRAAADGRVAALLLHHDGRLVAAALGALRAGYAVLTLNPGDPAEHLARLRRVAEPELVITDAGHGDQAHACGFDLDQLVLEPMAGEPVLATVAPDALGFLIATSGSTGSPKLVMQTHRNVLDNARRYTDGLGIDPDDRIAWLASLAGGQGLVTTWTALLNGATLCPFAIARRGVTGLAQWLEVERVTVFDTLPSILRSFVRTLPEGHRIGGVRLVRLASEPAQRSDFEAYRRHFPPDSVLASVLGSSETGIVARALIAPDDEVADGRLPVGEVADGLDVRLLGEHGQPVAPGAVGEIVVRGRHLAAGYWRDLPGTAQRFGTLDGERCFRTGDLAVRAPDGSLTVVGRADHQVKIRGHRLQLEEVETAIAALPGVAAVAVDAPVDDTGDASLIAYVSARSGAHLAPAALRRALRAVLPPHAVPAIFVPVEALPLNANGKVDRARLADLAPGAVAADDVRPLRSDTEELVANLWAEAFERDGVDPDVPFFELGGDSLTAAVIAAWVYEQFDVELDLGVFDAELTVARMADTIDRASLMRGGEPDPSERLRRRAGVGPAPLSYAQERIWSLAAHKGAGYNMTGGWRVSGELDVAALTSSVVQIIARHEILRTGFVERDGAPVAIVHETAPLALASVDGRAWEHPSSGAEALMDALAAAPFDLATPPLLRLCLLRVGEREHVLLRSAHHSVCDLPSWSIMLSELGAYYEAAVEGRDATLPEPPLQFTDFAIWEHARIRPGTARWAAEVDWWERHLTPPPPAFALPFATTVGISPPSGRRRAVDVVLDVEDAAALDRLGRATGATTFMTRLAAFSALVGLDSGLDELTLDTYLSLRRAVGLQTMFGPLFNRSVLRLRFSDRLGFHEWITRVRAEVIEVSRHGSVPYAQLMDELGRRGVPRPQGGARIEMLPESPPARFRGIEIEALPRHYVAPWGFALSVKREAGIDRWRAVFDPQLHDRDRVAFFLGRLTLLIAAACAEPERQLAELHRELEPAPDGDRSEEEPPMFYVVVTVKVDDYERWQHDFDEDAFGRLATAHGHEIARSVENPNLVTIRTAFGSVIAANAFRDRLLANGGFPHAISEATVLELAEARTY